MTDDADATPAAPDPDDHVVRLRAQIDAAKARRAGYRAEAAETVARGGPVRPTDEELGIIKTDDTLCSIPVVVLTTSLDRNDVHDSYDAHANSFISKPADYDQFVRALEALRNFWFSAAELPDKHKV